MRLEVDENRNSFNESRLTVVVVDELVHHHLRAHFVRDAIAFRIVQVKHVRTQLQLADTLTKAADLDMLALFHQYAGPDADAGDRGPI